MGQIELQGVSKTYEDGHLAVENLTLRIADGEFVILVGPSGCGKSTALRMIAGLEEVTSGRIRIDGSVVNDRPPKDRDVAMVFQNYALYPHMTVRENMGFALRLAGVPRAERNAKVTEAARLLELEAHLDRRPLQLSGGQRQRVAMGRAMVRKPTAFLLDEPLSNLDAKLRVEMRTQIARLQQALGTTTVHVTHDQTEAMTLGDRVAVMRAGQLQQVGAPIEIYDEPANLFVAGFIGSPAMNFLPARVDDEAVRLPFGAFEPAWEVGAAPSSPLVAGIRPEAFEDAAIVASDDRSGISFAAEVEVLEALGSESYAHLNLRDSGLAWGPRGFDGESSPPAAVAAALGSPGAGGRVVARLDRASTISAGDAARLCLDATKIHLFDGESGERVGGAVRPVR